MQKPSLHDANAERLRDAIDSGRTGDKVAWADPAIAPLGADEEAAGTPPTPEAMQQAFASETTRAVPQAHADRSAWIFAGLVVLCLGALIGAIIVLWR